MSAPVLPCGWDPVEVADAAVAGALPEHCVDCEFCRPVADAAVLSSSLGARVAAAVDDSEPPRELVPAVMRSVRTELRSAREVPVPSPHGAAFVTDHVVTTVLRDALDAAGALVVTSCRVDLDDASGLAVRIEGHGHWPDDLVAAAGAARAQVLTTLRAQFDLDAPGGVDVLVTDLIGPVA